MAPAAAVLMRAEMYRGQSQKEEALIDYLKVAVLFEDVAATHPEALFKAAEVLDEMRDPRAALRVAHGVDALDDQVALLEPTYEPVQGVATAEEHRARAPLVDDEQVVAEVA